MRLLQLHSDFIEYEPIAKEINYAEENVSKSKVRLEDLVVTLIAVEDDDDESIAKIAADEIKKYLDIVKSKRLLIYPYAHLSSNLASPLAAAEIIKSVERIAKESLSDVHRAPFGWTNKAIFFFYYYYQIRRGSVLSSKGGRKITIILVYFAAGRKTDSYK